MTSPAPGWYPDPGGAAPYRWWDGQAWTTATHPGTATATVHQPAAVPTQPTNLQYGVAVAGGGVGFASGQPYGATSTPHVVVSHQAQNDSLWHQNPHAMRAMIVTAIYVVIAVSTPFGLLGIVPLFAAIRSAQAGEKLGPLAVGAAVIALVVGISKFAHVF